MNAIDRRIENLGITLPQPPAAVALYAPFVRTGSLVFISGQLPLLDGKLQHVGRVGDTITLEEARSAARLCALNIIAQLKVACGGDLSKVTQCVRIGGFVSCIDTFTEQPKVINAASQVMVDIFGEAGRHARTAVGTNALPLGVSVEIEALFSVQA